MDSIETELASYRELEQQERAAASSSESEAARDDHTMQAERYADEAWRIEEESDVAYQPSGLWDA